MSPPYYTQSAPLLGAKGVLKDASVVQVACQYFFSSSSITNKVVGAVHGIPDASVRFDMGTRPCASVLILGSVPLRLFHFWGASVCVRFRFWGAKSEIAGNKECRGLPTTPPIRRRNPNNSAGQFGGPIFRRNASQSPGLWPWPPKHTVPLVAVLSETCGNPCKLKIFLHRAACIGRKMTMAERK